VTEVLLRYPLKTLYHIITACIYSKQFIAACVQVTVGTPVFGELQKDDIILEIQNCDASRLTHKQAQDMIRNAGGSMLVRVRRSARHFPLPVRNCDADPHTR